MHRLGHCLECLFLLPLTQFPSCPFFIVNFLYFSMFLFRFIIFFYKFSFVSDWTVSQVTNIIFYFFQILINGLRSTYSTA